MNFFKIKKYTFRVSFVFLIFLFGKNGFSQAAITGKISDKETGEEMISANITVTKNGNFIQGETTDIDGNYIIQVDSGEYDMEISYTGYAIQKITGIVVNKGKTTKVDVQISSGGLIDWEVAVNSGCCYIPLIRHNKTATGITLSTREDEDFFKKLPTRNINEMIMIAPGVTFGQ